MTLPAPLTSPACDLRDFPFMPLDVQRLRDSDLAALEAPEACWAAVQLWGASWHQVPGTSLSSSLPVATSQMRTVLSKPLEATVFPSGANATAITEPP